MSGRQIHEGTAVRRYGGRAVRLLMTSRAGSVLVSRCVCRDTSFAVLLPQARASGWTLADLMRETGCGGQCGLCRPYLSRMLRTGETEFHELLTDPLAERGDL